MKNYTELEVREMCERLFSDVKNEDFLTYDSFDDWFLYNKKQSIYRLVKPERTNDIKDVLFKKRGPRIDTVLYLPDRIEKLEKAGLLHECFEEIPDWKVGDKFKIIKNPIPSFYNGTAGEVHTVKEVNGDSLLYAEGKAVNIKYIELEKI